MIAVANIRKITAQTAHLQLASSAGEPIVTTLCGRDVVAGQWMFAETGAQPCTRCTTKLAKTVQADHVAALAEDQHRYPSPNRLGLAELNRRTA